VPLGFSEFRLIFPQDGRRLARYPLTESRPYRWAESAAVQAPVGTKWNLRASM